jgi:hypothetical protein
VGPACQCRCRPPPSSDWARCAANGVATRRAPGLRVDRPLFEATNPPRLFRWRPTATLEPCRCASPAAPCGRASLHHNPAVQRLLPTGARARPPLRRSAHPSSPRSSSRHAACQAWPCLHTFRRSPEPPSIELRLLPRRPECAERHERLWSRRHPSSLLQAAAVRCRVGRRRPSALTEQTPSSASSSTAGQTPSCFALVAAAPP